MEQKTKMMMKMKTMTMMKTTRTMKKKMMKEIPSCLVEMHCVASDSPWSSSYGIEP